MFGRQTLLIAGISLSFGFGCSPSSQPDPAQVDAEFDRLEQEIMAATNIFPLPKDQDRPDVPQPKSHRDDGQLHLDDLDIILRKVTFDEPIDGNPALLFSETEITNQAFATFLADTNQWRDDTELQKVEEKQRGGIVTTRSDGTTSISHVSSTGWPSMDVHRPELMWRNGHCPEGLGNHPVSLVTTRDAMNFCKWLTDRYKLNGTFRLPTDEEWLFAAYGTYRKFPWGDDERVWTATSTQPVKTRPDLRTADGLYEMWGNVSELVLSQSNGYGGRIEDKYSPIITQWLGTSYEDEEIRGEYAKPRQDYWGYTHSPESRSDSWGFRIVFVPSIKNEFIKLPEPNDG